MLWKGYEYTAPREQPSSAARRAIVSIDFWAHLRILFRDLAELFTTLNQLVTRIEAVYNAVGQLKKNDDSDPDMPF